MNRTRLKKALYQKEMLLRNLKQIVEALGCTNRLYFYERFGRNARNDDELVEFYESQGGARNFREREIRKQKEKLR